MDADLRTVREMFGHMAADGVDTERPMKYGYFFIDQSKTSLERAAAWLADRDYTVEDIWRNHDGTLTMELVKTEVHTPESLNKRNEAMHRLAEKFDIDTYDGWDVEVA